MSIAQDMAALLAQWDLTGDLVPYGNALGQPFVEVEGYVSDLDGGAVIRTPSGYFPTVIADGPVAYYRLNEASGTNAADQMGNNPGTYSGGYTLNKPSSLGDKDSCVLLDGLTGHVLIPFNAALCPTKFSLEAWVYPTSTATGVVINATNGSSNFGVLLYMASGSVSAYIGNGTGDTVVSAAANAASINSWHHVVLTYDGTTAILYVDGAQQASVACAYSPNASGALTLGNWGSNGNDQLAGYLDEVAFYNHALTAAQVAAHYAAQSGPGGIITTYSGAQVGWQPLWDVDIAPHNALPYLATVMGETLPSGISDTNARALIRSAPNQSRGTPQAVANAIKNLLTGSQIVGLRERFRSDGTADNDALAIVTFLSQTPDQNAVLAAIRRTLPADITPYYQCLTGATWATIDGTSTWAAIESAHGPTWGSIEASSVLNGYTTY